MYPALSLRVTIFDVKCYSFIVFIFMQVQPYMQVGIINKVHGFKGAVIILVNKEEAVVVNNIKILFIQINGTFVPYFIKKFSLY